MRASVFFLVVALLALVAAGAAIMFRFFEAANYRGIQVRQGFAVPATAGYEAVTGGWSYGDNAAAARPSMCVAVMGPPSDAATAEGEAAPPSSRNK